MRRRIFHKGDLDLALIVAFNNAQEKKIVHYEAYLMKCVAVTSQTVTAQDGSKIRVRNLPQMEGVLKTKITKTKAKELIAQGVPVTAGYFLK